MNESHESQAPLLSAYLDGELDPARRRQVEEHLATCAICAEELARLQAGDAVLAGLRPTPMAPDQRADLRRRVRGQGARTILTGGLLTVIVVLLRAMAHDLAILKRKDLPLWGRLGLASGNALLAAPGIALCVELLRDVRALLEYAWLSNESNDAGDAHP